MDKKKSEKKICARIVGWLSKHKIALLVLSAAVVIHIVVAGLAWQFYYSHKQTEIFWLLDFFDKFGIITAAISLLVSIFTWANTRDLVKSRVAIEPPVGPHSGVLAIQCNNYGAIDEDIKQFIKPPKFDDLIFKNTQEGKVAAIELEESINSANELLVNHQFNLETISGIRGVFLKGKSESIDVEKAANGELDYILNLITSILKKQKISSLHVFFMGPVTIPFVVADYFANTFILHIYEHTHDKENKAMSYYYVTTIAKNGSRE